MTSASSSLPLDPSRTRRIPLSGFGWIDRRFFKSGYAAELSQGAMALYVFLCSVADQRGQSWYGEPRIGQFLRLSPSGLDRARKQLITADLIRFQAPNYQVVSLPANPLRPLLEGEARPSSGPSQLRDLLRRHF